MASDEKICPLKEVTITVYYAVVCRDVPPHGAGRCEKWDCVWWDEEEKECLITLGLKKLKEDR